MVRTHRAREIRTLMATMVTMNTRGTTRNLAMGQIIHTTVERLTMFWAIPSHTMAQGLVLLAIAGSTRLLVYLC
jgi:hypothetical protein